MQWTVAIGVDTHKEVHVAVALDALGAELDSREIATTRAGYRSLLTWAQELGVPAFAVEGTGSYGAGLVRFLERAGVSVYECERPRPALAARRLLSGERLSLPRGGGRREDLRLLLLERRSVMQARNAALNQLSALLVTAPEHVRERLGALSGERLAQAASRLRPRPEVVNGVLRRLGQRAERLSKEVADAERALAALLAEVAPALLEECGVGPVCGAQLLVSSGDPGRMTSEASFAALAGTSPVDASSGKQRRHRLNRGGDRQLNWALHVIALARIRHHGETTAYYQRLLAAGKAVRQSLAALPISLPIAGLRPSDEAKPTKPPAPTLRLMDVLFRTGSLLHRLPESTAVLLAENLRAWPIEEGSRAVADKIEFFLVGETSEPIELEGSERVAVREALDVLMAGPHDSPTLREFFESLGIEPRR